MSWQLPVAVWKVRVTDYLSIDKYQGYMQLLLCCLKSWPRRLGIQVRACISSVARPPIGLVASILAGQWIVWS